MTYENLLVDVREGDRFVTVNRPAKRNALDALTVGELDDAFARAGRRRSGARRGADGRGRQGLRRRRRHRGASALARGGARRALSRARAAGRSTASSGSASRSWRRSTATRSAAAASWRWPATCASPPRTPARHAGGQARADVRLRRDAAAAPAGRQGPGARAAADRRAASTPRGAAHRPRQQGRVRDACSPRRRRCAAAWRRTRRSRCARRSRR